MIIITTTSNRSRIIEIGPPTTLLLSTITMSTGNEDVTDPQDTSTAAVCRALTISPDGTYSEENECDCPRCEPANDAFIPRSDIDPHRTNKYKLNVDGKTIEFGSDGTSLTVEGDGLMYADVSGSSMTLKSCLCTSSC